MASGLKKAMGTQNERHPGGNIEHEALRELLLQCLTYICRICDICNHLAVRAEIVYSDADSLIRLELSLCSSSGLV